MRTPLPLLILAPLFFTACGGGGQPIKADLGGGETRRFQLGPAGGLIRGDGPLANFELEIPAGALGQLTTVSLSVGDAISLPASAAVTATAELHLVPDPGPLRKPAALRWRLDWPATRPVGDLLVAGRMPEGAATFGGEQMTPVLAADLGSYDRPLRTFSAEIGRLGPLQVRASETTRALEDAQQLLDLALGELGRLSDGGLIAAGRRLDEALRADPFFPAGRFLRALTRLAVWGNDRGDTGPGIQSLGEALQGLGLDLAQKSLLRRATEGDWPVRLRPLHRPPSLVELLDFLGPSLRAVAQAGIDDLNYVTTAKALELEVPAALAGLAGIRQVDAADLHLLRGALGTVLGLLGQLEAIDLRADPGVFSGASPRPASLQAWLATNPSFARPLGVAPPGLAEVWARALLDLATGLQALIAETDPQADDLLVFAAGFDRQQQDRWLLNLQRLYEGLRAATPASLDLAGRAALAVDLGALQRGGLDLRGGLPRIDGFLPLAGTLGDPSLGGLFPGLDQDRAARLYHLVSDHRPPEVASLVVDGLTGDWPSAAEALQPVDPAADVSGLPGLDLGRVFVARRGDALVLRFDLHEGGFGSPDGQENVYEFTLRPARDDALVAGAHHQVEVWHDGASWQLRGRRDGRDIALRSEVASAGSVLELSVNRFDLLRPDEPRRAWVLRAFASGMRSKPLREATDRSRRILLRF